MSKVNKPIIEYITDFLDWCAVQKGLAEKTQVNYANFLKHFENFLKLSHLAGLLPHQLSNDHVWQYRLYLSRQKDARSGREIKKSTQNYYLIALRAMLNFFSERDIDSLAPDKIKLAKDAKEKKLHFLKLEQIEVLLNAPKIGQNICTWRDKAILEALFSTGLRVAELAALNRDQFNNIENKFFFELQIIGKGGKPRTVYFSERALLWLKKYLGSRRDDDNALFINYRARKDAARRLTSRSIERLVKYYCKISGLPLMTTPHTLRHSYATDLLEQGVDLRLIQEFLGHANIATTQIYTHVTNKKLRDVHQQFHSGNRLK